MTFQPPRGMRDFLPAEMARREWMMGVIRDVARSFGYETVSTPGIESWELLSAKGGGGEEAKNEIYTFTDKGGRELGLRFEFTASFARLLATNPQLPKPFKRYQMGPLWRYDRPQAGRYRELFGCEIDCAGSTLPESDAEIIAVSCAIFRKLGIPAFTVRISNRQLLEGLIRAAGVPEGKLLDVFRSIDKLDKIGVEGVRKEMERRGVDKNVISGVLQLTTLKGDVLGKVAKLLGTQSTAGLENLKAVLASLEPLGEQATVDLSIVRGLEYYTGTVFEIAVPGWSISFGGGGRYDKLVELYGGRPTPCVGIGIGFERIFDEMSRRNLFPPLPPRATVLVVPVGDSPGKAATALAKRLREADVACEMDLMGRNVSKQLEAANARGIPWAVFVGKKELAAKAFTLRDMKTGKESSVRVEELIATLRR